MPKCDTTVTTPTGVFTYFSEEVSYCQAKYNCAEIGQILAPITKLSDIEALQSVADVYNPDCDFHSDIYSYHIGLDISICGRNQYRLFTNNVVSNETEHGSLYNWRHGSEKKDTSYALFNPHHTKLYVISDRRRIRRIRYICLKPNSTNSVAETLTDSNVADHQNSNAFYVCGALMVALVGVMLLVKIRNEKNEVYKLKKKNESLQKKMNICTAKF